MGVDRGRVSLGGMNASRDGDNVVTAVTGGRHSPLPIFDVKDALLKKKNGWSRAGETTAFDNMVRILPQTE